jgi:hypothetical protein
LSPMKSSLGGCSLLSCHTETCWYALYSKNSELIVIVCRWRRTRRAAHEILTKVIVRDYHPVFCKEAILLASAMSENPHALDKHIQRSSASATMSILYDFPTLENEHDETLTRIHAFIDRLSAAATPGAHLVELFPWMIHIPERYESMPFFVCLITWNYGTSDLRSGNVREWSVFGSIQPCSLDFWIPFAVIS